MERETRESVAGVRLSGVRYVKVDRMTPDDSSFTQESSGHTTYSPVCILPIHPQRDKHRPLVTSGGGYIFLTYFS
jgi:hypothetical protein